MCSSPHVSLGVKDTPRRQPMVSVCVPTPNRRGRHTRPYTAPRLPWVAAYVKRASGQWQYPGHSEGKRWAVHSQSLCYGRGEGPPQPHQRLCGIARPRRGAKGCSELPTRERRWMAEEKKVVGGGGRGDGAGGAESGALSEGLGAGGVRAEEEYMGGRDAAEVGRLGLRGGSLRGACKRAMGRGRWGGGR